MELEEAKSQLLDERTDESGFNDNVLALELERVNENMGIIRGEYLEAGNLEAKGSILIPVDNQNEDSWWDGMEVGDKRALGFQLDTRKATWAERFTEFFTRGIEEGRPQEFIPGLPS